MRTVLLIFYFLALDAVAPDPCVNHSVLDQPWRTTDSNVFDSNWPRNDMRLEIGWYRFKSSGGWKIPETRIVEHHCNTKHPGWIQGSHPTVGQGVVQRTVCFTNSVTGCQETQDIKVKNCTDFIVYELKPTFGDNRIYCTDPLSVVTSTSATPTYNAPTETPSHSEKGDEKQWFQVHVTAPDDMDEDLLREAVQEKLRMMYGDLDLQVAALPEGGQCVREDEND